MTELDSLWEAIQNSFRKSKGDTTYKNLIAPAKPLDFANGRLRIQLPSQYHRDFWEQLTDQVVEIVYQRTGQEIRPDYVLATDPTPLAQTPPRPQSTFKEETPLNPEYTFQTFIEGRSNMMAYASAFAASESPGDQYNPLLIYGGVGLGKTHLMQAIANNMKFHNPSVRIKYVTSENFMNDFVNSIKSGTQEEFRREYRDLDALLVDDIQFFASKGETQTEFFNTFNVLYDNKKQIVLTSDKDPREIPNLTARLVSRFMWGVPVEITSPALETRIAILKSKAEEEHLDVPNDVLNFVAQRINTNVRELEGALMRIRVFSELHQQPITLKLATEALQGMVANTETTVTIDLIQKRVATYYNINQSDITGKKRTKNIVVPRQIAMYLSRELTDNSLPKIGKEFGGKDHTTVLHAIDKIERQVQEDARLQGELVKLKNDLQA